MKLLAESVNDKEISFKMKVMVLNHGTEMSVLDVV